MALIRVSSVGSQSKRTALQLSAAVQVEDARFSKLSPARALDPHGEHLGARLLLAPERRRELAAYQVCRPEEHPGCMDVAVMGSPADRVSHEELAHVARDFKLRRGRREGVARG